MQKPGAIAEAIGAVAVITTLVYLALQIREGTLALRTTMRDSVFNHLNEWNYALVVDGNFWPKETILNMLENDRY